MAAAAAGSSEAHPFGEAEERAFAPVVRFELARAHGEPLAVVLEQDALAGDEGFSGLVWPQAARLARFLAGWPRAPARLGGGAALDLGAGCGLVSCVLALLGAREVVTTDTRGALPHLEANVRANVRDATAVRCAPLEWDNAADIAAARRLCPSGFGVVTATDCLYNEAAVGSLLSTASQLLADDGVFLLCGMARPSERQLLGLREGDRVDCVLERFKEHAPALFRCFFLCADVPADAAAAPPPDAIALTRGVWLLFKRGGAAAEDADVAALVRSAILELPSRDTNVQ